MPHGVRAESPCATVPKATPDFCWPSAFNCRHTRRCHWQGHSRYNDAFKASAHGCATWLHESSPCRLWGCMEDHTAEGWQLVTRQDITAPMHWLVSLQLQRARAGLCNITGTRLRRHVPSACNMQDLLDGQPTPTLCARLPNMSQPLPVVHLSTCTSKSTPKLLHASNTLAALAEYAVSLAERESDNCTTTWA